MTDEKGGRAMTEPIRHKWCDRHDQPGFVCKRDGYDIDDCSLVLLVESRDGDGRLLGLLAADECGCHGGDGCDPRNISEGLYPQCDGSGFTIRAAGVPPALSTPGTALPGTWVRANFKPGGKMVRVAVLPVEEI